MAVVVRKDRPRRYVTQTVRDYLDKMGGGVVGESGKLIGDMAADPVFRSQLIGAADIRQVVRYLENLPDEDGVRPRQTTEVYVHRDATGIYAIIKVGYKFTAEDKRQLTIIRRRR